MLPRPSKTTAIPGLSPGAGCAGGQLRPVTALTGPKRNHPTRIAHSSAISDRLEITEAVIRRAGKKPTPDEVIDVILAALVMLLRAEAGYA